MFNQQYIQMCIEQGARTGDASFFDVLFMCCGSASGWEQ